MPQPTASIQFTQGVTTYPAGESVDTGSSGSPVVVSNAGSPGAVRYRYTLVWVPLASGLTTGIQQDGPLPTYTFTPDVQNGFTVQLDVFDIDNNLVDTDVRTFVVPRTSGRIIPGFTYTPEQLNFGGNPFGWAPYLEAWLVYVDGLVVGGGGRTMAVATATATLSGPLTYNLAAGTDLLLCDSTDNPITVVLPLPSGRVSAIQQVPIFIKDKGGQAAVNNITLSPHGAELIDGLNPNSSALINTGKGTMIVVTDGTNWYLF